MDSAQQVIRFCTECKFCKVVEIEGEFKVFCTRRKKPNNFRAETYIRTITIFKKYNCPACAYFIDINDGVTSSI